jgi:hypothetical protein
MSEANYKQNSLTLFYEINFMNRHEPRRSKSKNATNIDAILEMALKQILHVRSAILLFQRVDLYRRQKLKFWFKMEPLRCS